MDRVVQLKFNVIRRVLTREKIISYVTKNFDGM